MSDESRRLLDNFLESLRPDQYRALASRLSPDQKKTLRQLVRQENVAADRLSRVLVDEEERPEQFAENPREARLRSLAEMLVSEVDGSLEDFGPDIAADPIAVIEYLSIEIYRDLTNSLHGKRDLGDGLREALEIAAARGRGEISPDQEVRLTALAEILAGWNGGRDD